MPPRTSLSSGFTLQSPRTLPPLPPFSRKHLSFCLRVPANSVDFLSYFLSPSRFLVRARTFVCVLTNRYVQVGVIFFRVREVGFYNAPVEAPQLVASFVRLILVLSDTDMHYI